MYFFSPDGALQNRVPIPSRYFRPVSEPMPDGRGPVSEFVRWSEGFSSVSQVNWSSEGTLLIEYFDMIGNFPVWRLLHMSRAGDHAFFETLDTPRLLATDTVTGSTLMVAPGAEAPNQWARVRLRHAVVPGSTRMDGR